jgi:hypothetical protein
MLEYVGNCKDVIDWHSVIESIEDQQSAYIGPRHDVGHHVSGVEEVAKPLREAGYKMKHEGGNASWDMYLPGTNFDKKIAEKFCEWVGMSSYINAWISRVKPGDVAPWHWDITDDEKTLEHKKEIVRYHCHISPPAPGHVLIVEDHCLYNQETGATWKWPKRTSWHAGSNAGLVPKYIFNIWG